MAATRVLVTGAGTSGGNNLIRDLRVGDPTTFVAGCQADRFVLKKSIADAHYLVQRSDHPNYLDTIRRAAERAGADVVIPTTDAEVRALCDLRRIGPTRLFLPSAEVVELCQDKYLLACRLRERGVQRHNVRLPLRAQEDCRNARRPQVSRVRGQEEETS